MEKVTRFKIHRKTNLPMALGIEPIEFNWAEDCGIPIYEHYNCYIPKFRHKTEILEHYSVYFWKDGYWEFINNLPIDQFDQYIAPRLLDRYNMLKENNESKS